MGDLTKEKMRRYSERGALRALLGGLAEWMLKDGRPTLPKNTDGLMLPLLVVTDEELKDLGLAPGFMLPLRWEKRGGHDRRLPTSLHQVADRVLRVVGASLGRELEHRLELPKWIAVDLSELSVTWESAWTTLAAGLFVAASGGENDLRVFGTATYNEDTRGVGAVEGIKEKLAAIERIDWGSGPKEVVVFVAEKDKADAERHAAEWMKIESYPVCHERGSIWDIRDTLEPHLDRLQVAPKDADKFIEWVNSATLSQPERAKRYQRPDVVARLAELLRQRGADKLGAVEVLLVSAGANHFNQAALLSLALKPTRIIIACQGDSRGCADDFKNWLRNQDEAWSERVEICEVPKINRVDDMKAWREKVRGIRALVQRSQGQVVVDVTGGLRSMMWALQWAGGEGARLINIVGSHERFGDEFLLIYDELVEQEEA
jgi:uncharacterized protein YjiS (DUF1127 family)